MKVKEFAIMIIFVTVVVAIAVVTIIIYYNSISNTITPFQIL